MNDLHFDIYIAAKPDAVWKALTGNEGVAALYFGSHLVTSFQAGSPYHYVGPDGKGGEVTHVEGEILAAEPGQRLQITHRAGKVWQKGPKAYSSRLTYSMEDLGFATKLSVDHDRWEEGDPGHAHNATGWMIFLSSVKSYVETGKALPLPM
jgi:uncharacterized protein YndB with AHSA1/START domain